MQQLIETYGFTTLAGLRDFLNGFEELDLETVLPVDSDQITMRWYEETLSDGNTVYNVSLRSE